MSFDGEPDAQIIAAEGQRRHQRARSDAWKHAHVGEQPVVEADLRRRVGVAALRQREFHRDGALGDESRIHVSEADQASNEQPGAGEQHERERHFGDDEHLARACRVRAARTARGVLEGFARMRRR